MCCRDNAVNGLPGGASRSAIFWPEPCRARFSIGKNTSSRRTSFACFANGSTRTFPAQEILATIHEEILSTTKLPDGDRVSEGGNSAHRVGSAGEWRSWRTTSPVSRRSSSRGPKKTARGSIRRRPSTCCSTRPAIGRERRAPPGCSPISSSRSAATSWATTAAWKPWRRTRCTTKCGATGSCGPGCNWERSISPT